MKSPRPCGAGAPAGTETGLDGATLSLDGLADRVGRAVDAELTGLDAGCRSALTCFAHAATVLLESARGTWVGTGCGAGWTATEAGRLGTFTGVGETETDLEGGSVGSARLDCLRTTVFSGSGPDVWPFGSSMIALSETDEAEARRLRFELRCRRPGCRGEVGGVRGEKDDLGGERVEG